MKNQTPTHSGREILLKYPKLIALVILLGSYGLVWACTQNTACDYVSGCTGCPSCTYKLGYVDYDQTTQAYIYCNACGNSGIGCDLTSNNTYSNVYAFTYTGTCTNSSCINMTSTYKQLNNVAKCVTYAGGCPS